jgi:Arc/MetJ-type ribon-helix-helix transcriptional regulator
MMPPVPLKTTLQREEAWQLDDIAQQVGVRRSHVMRAALRYVLENQEEFLTWLNERDAPAVVESPDDPTPTPA